jgi:hypothetical protein
VTKIFSVTDSQGGIVVLGYYMNLSISSFSEEASLEEEELSVVSA